MRFMKTMAIAAVSLTLVGCSHAHHTYDRTWHDSHTCSATKLKDLLVNNQNLRLVEFGELRGDLFSEYRMGQPDRNEFVTLADGSFVEVAYYQVGSKMCGDASNPSTIYEPIVLKNGRVIGVGQDFYRRSIHPRILRVGYRHYYDRY